MAQKVGGLLRDELNKKKPDLIKLGKMMGILKAGVELAKNSNPTYTDDIAQQIQEEFYELKRKVEDAENASRLKSAS